MKKIDDILDEELNKLKISKKEREILIEDCECVCESDWINKVIEYASTLSSCG